MNVLFLIGRSEELHYGKKYIKRMLHRADDAWLFDANYNSVGKQSIIMVKVNGLPEYEVQKAMKHLGLAGISCVLYYNDNSTFVGNLDDYDTSYQALYGAISSSNDPRMPELPEYEEITEYENRMRTEGYVL